MAHAIIERPSNTNTQPNRTMKKLTSVRLAVAENGWRWTGLYVVSAGLKRVPRGARVRRRIDEAMGSIEARRSLPGINSVHRNYMAWQVYDWRDAGDEWDRGPGWKASIVTGILDRYREQRQRVLELGPGAGRWSEFLATRSVRLTLVDLSDRCVDLCRRRLARFQNVDYFVNDGVSLPLVGDGTIDFIWSWDVFVHISPRDTAKYFREFARVLTAGGRGVINHPDDGALPDGWRSRTTSQWIQAHLENAGLRVVAHFPEPDDFDNPGTARNIVAVFEKTP
jgi:SAM-dependent methyltransferase